MRGVDWHCQNRVSKYNHADVGPAEANEAKTETTTERERIGSSVSLHSQAVLAAVAAAMRMRLAACPRLKHQEPAARDRAACSVTRL